MLQFIPPGFIQKYQDYNYKKFDDIPEGDFNTIRKKIEALQSDEPLITIGLIAWNEQDYILATIASLAETVCEFPLEIIIVNNNSTDDTQKFIDRCGVKGIFEKQQGYPFARQAGLMAAKGKYFISGDTDTIYRKTWAEEMVKPLMKQGVVCSYSLHAFYTDERKYPFSILLYQQAKLFNIYFKNLKRPQLNTGGASMAFIKEKAMIFGGYNTNVVRGSDGYIALQLMDHGKIKMVTTKKAMIYTNMRRTKSDGNLMQAFWKRFKSNMRHFFTFFTRQKID